MSKRIYHPEHKKLFQFRKDGNFYTFIGGKEVCLESNDINIALKHLKFLEESNSFFGGLAFNKKVGDLFPVFLKHKEKDLRPSTYKNYIEIAAIFDKAGLYDLQLARMTQKAWLKFCASKVHSIKDFQNHRNLMHQFLVWATMHEYIKAVPILQNPKHIRRKRMVIPTDHILLIFKEAKKSKGGILLYLTFLALQGPRGVEVRKLLKAMVDLENYSAMLSEDTVKTHEARQIPLHPVVVELLKQHFKKHETARIRTKWVFPNAADPKRHMSTSGFKTAWATCVRNAGLKSFGYTLHDWRSTYEKWLEMSALNETQKDKATGASREQRLKTYVRNLTADDLRGAEKVVNIPELIDLLENQTVGLALNTGKQLGGK